MEAAPRTSNESAGVTPMLTFSILSSFLKIHEKIKAAAMTLKKLAVDDPRRVRHSLKVGLTLAVISVFYYVKALYSGLGESTMWAVLTVVVVTEYTAGATLYKGLNRVIATLLAGALGLGAHRLAALAGNDGKSVLLGVFVFLLAAMVTFSRFLPEIKARYDYGATIFILTFSLVSVSGYRVEELIVLAHHRLSTVAIGVAACMATSIAIFPVWAGEELHNLVASNLDTLASFLEGVGKEYFKQKLGSYKNLEGASFLIGYKNVLNSKAMEDSLANFARWEPGHGHFGFRHPWKQYLKIGALARQCACSMHSLNGFISATEKSEALTNSEFQQNIQIACAVMCSESGKALAELASAIRDMRPPTAAAGHLGNAATVGSKVKMMVPSETTTVEEVLLYATMANLLLEIVHSAKHVVDAVVQLANMAKFNHAEEAKSGVVKHNGDGESLHVVIDVRN